jgi:methylthioribose-1-phosphate isomerase
MADNKDGGARSQVSRVALHRVMIDTPALLNMVKHCREADVKSGARGAVMGVLKDSVEGGGQQLFITQTMPELVGAKLQMQELKEAIENES